MLCLIVSLADVFAWQMLFTFWNVADVIAKRKMLSSYLCNWQMLLPYFCGRCYTTCIMLQHVVLVDVIAKWQME